MDAKGAFRAVVKHWLLFGIVTLFGLAAGVFVVVTATPKYASTVTFFVSIPTADDNGNALNAADQFATSRVNTYVRLVTSDRLGQLVQQDVGRNLSVNEIRQELAGSADLNTVLLTVTATDTNQAMSLALARSVSTQFPKMIETIDDVGTRSNNGISLTVVSGPRAVEGAIRPSRVLNLAIGLFGGALLGLALAVLREVLDRTVRGSTDLRDTVGLPVVGVIPNDPTVADEPLVIGRQVRSIRAEAYRQMRTNLQFMNVDSPVQLIVVSSSIAAEGKSTTSANSRSSSPRRTARRCSSKPTCGRPRVTDYLGLERSVGLSNVLAGQVDVADVLQPWGEGNLVVLGSGPVPPNPSEMLGSQGMADLLERLRTQFDVIILDTPPLLPVTDAAVASVRADGAIVVVRHGHTNRGQVVSAVESLDAVGARVLGTVLNMAKGRGESRGAYDGYGYHEDTDAGSVVSAVSDDGLVHVAASGPPTRAVEAAPVDVAPVANPVGNDAAERDLMDDLMDDVHEVPEDRTGSPSADARTETGADGKTESLAPADNAGDEPSVATEPTVASTRAARVRRTAKIKPVDVTGPTGGARPADAAKPTDVDPPWNGVGSSAPADGSAVEEAPPAEPEVVEPEVVELATGPDESGSSDAEPAGDDAPDDVAPTSAAAKLRNGRASGTSQARNGRNRRSNRGRR